MDLNWCKNLDNCLKDIVLNKLGFEKMTIVQSAAIPVILDNKDVCVEACTGSGKSLAFILPALQLLLNKLKLESTLKKHVSSVLIISPTRELTVQLYKLVKLFLDSEELKKSISCLLLVGGKNCVYDIQSFKKKGGNIILSTPGRFLEMINRCDFFSSKIKKNLEFVILDEADRLLQLGFEETLEKIFDFLPKQRKTGLFSATMTKRIDLLIKIGLRNPVKIEIKEKKNLESIQNKNLVNEELETKVNQSIESTGLQLSPYLTNEYLVIPSFKLKLPYLVYFLNKNCNKKTIVFFSTCSQINFFSLSIKQFLKEELEFYILHRKLDYKRQKIFNLFKENKTGCVLFCTDIMSRGIDIPEVDYVINFDLPNDLQTFIHRSGRSGHKIGVQGNSLTFCVGKEIKFIELCQNKSMNINKIKFNFKLINDLQEELNLNMKNLTRSDIKFFELGLKAFVSFVRNYSFKNIMSNYLFEEIDLVDLINSYSLIKIPEMPELNGKLKGKVDKLEIDANDQEIAKNYKKTLKSNRDINGINEKQKLREEKLNFRKKLKKMNFQKRKEFLNKIDLDDLAEDMRMIKKAKKGKISEKDLDHHFNI